jgi:uncharacterized membrane protein YeaQ/YmgE (transglycosylase-associated protein family)
MAIFVWLMVGLAIGVSADRLSTRRYDRFAVELAIGLVASIAGGLLFVLLG